MTAIRELSIASVVHPEHLEAGASLLVDHPTVRPLQDGAPDLGWDGDNRLAVYLHLQSQRFTLYRLEADGEYRGVCSLPPGAEITPASINRLIVRLVEIDSRRGFDPFADIIDHQNAVRAEQQRVATDAVTDWADKFHFTLSRAHLPGIDIVRPRMTPTRSA